LGAREEILQLEVRVVLIQDVFATFSNPDNAPLTLVPDLPELGALASIGAANLFGITINLVISLLVGVATAFVEAFARLAPGQIARGRNPGHLVPTSRDAV